jgi:hypothetical protein
MSLLGLPAWAYAAGLAGLAAALLGLHLLRIRLRRQTVDSLLFFRQVGAVHKPRVLLGRPSRWLSFALGMALLAAAWTAFAGPRGADGAPSRVVLVDATAQAPAGSSRSAALLRAVEALAADAGLGPRGRIVAFGPGAVTIWSAGEPLGRGAERLAALPDRGTASSRIWAALGEAARSLRPGDEILVLGGPPDLPDRIDGIPLLRAAVEDLSAAPAIVSVRLTDTPEAGGGRALRIEAGSGGGPGAVRVELGAGEALAADIDTAAGATAVVELGPLPDRALPALEILVTHGGGASARTRIDIPEARPLRVHVGADRPPAVALAVEADPRLEPAADLAAAEVAVVLAGSGGLPPELPALIVEPGQGERIRQPRRTAACPLPLGLRDRVRPAAALHAEPGEVWVEDAASGAALVRRSGIRIQIVGWLLDDPTHRDVPALILAAVHALDARPPVVVGPLAAPLPAPVAAPAALAARADAWPWIPVLLLCALLALCTDAWLHHRSRIA